MSSLGPGELFMSAPVRCPVHGQMHYHFARDTWICHGWDGEGCDHEVPAEWVHIGDTA
jgi:hypothetical protein